ncbi:MAG: SURF1 family protein [Kangiellaceae bacterium]|nr:SURF1 family protein [Kangiellaceae bacterium]
MRHSVQYKIGRYQLTVNFWFLIVFLLVQSALNELGFWQLSRAQEKQQRLHILKKQTDTKIVDLVHIKQGVVNNFSQVELDVELAERKNILVENKVQNGKLGYHVLNLVQETVSNKYLLVNRGWIEGRAKRSELPIVNLPSSDWRIYARLYPINQQMLSDDAEIEFKGNNIRVPVLDEHILKVLEKQLSVDIEPYLMRLNPDTEHVFEVNWAWVSMPPEKHLAYAFQWFALSLAFLIISLFVLIKKEDR